MSYICKSLDCELEGKTHEWFFESKLKMWEHYGLGEMTYRECDKCGRIDFIEFVNHLGTIDFNVSCHSF